MCYYRTVTTAVLDAAPVVALLADAHAVVDALSLTPLPAGPDESILDALRDLERLQRRLSTVGYALIAEADIRALPTTLGARSMTALLRGLLRIDPAEAHSRVQAAAAAGPRQHAGQVLEPVFAQVAAAQADGSISERHARVIERCIDGLPEDAAPHTAQVEADLVAAATTLCPTDLAKVVARVRDCYDPDGLLRDHAERERRRTLELSQRPDGSGRIDGELTAELTERLLGVMDAFGRPANGPNAGVGGSEQGDVRTAGQRRHDALLEALRLLDRSDRLPTAGGVSATVIVTMTDDAWRTGRGLARLGHGAVLPARAAIDLAGGDLRLLTVAMDRARAVTAYSTSHRLFTEQQRLALIARDRGCTFPGCDVAAGRCEAHHVRDAALGGPTSVDNGALLCPYHHAHFDRLGWQCEMRDGRPHWRPPRWLDPDRVPIRNVLHDPGG